MQTVFVVLLVVHALSGVFWAGTTFTLARTGGQGVRALRWPQAGASLVAILSGVALWGLAHRSAFGPVERSLAVGALAALAAAAVQFTANGRAMRQAGPAGDAALAGVVPGQRIAAAMLALTIAAMVAARYL